MGGPGRMGGPMGGPGRMGGPGMMGGGMGGPGMMGDPGAATLDAIANLQLTEEQRSKVDAIRAELDARQKEVIEKLTKTSDKLRKLQEEQMKLSRTMADLSGHMTEASIDAANRAEELLTDEQRQSLMNTGTHMMMPRGGMPYGGSSPGAAQQTP